MCCSPGLYVPLQTTTEISIYDDDYDFYQDVTTTANDGYDDQDDDSTWQVLLYPETTSRYVYFTFYLFRKSFSDKYKKLIFDLEN